jgi:hypothetical protein
MRHFAYGEIIGRLFERSLDLKAEISVMRQCSSGYKIGIDED